MKKRKRLAPGVRNEMEDVDKVSKPFSGAGYAGSRHALGKFKLRESKSMVLTGAAAMHDYDWSNQ
jgi:hypothetical protein